jgi:hypothetical protein
VLVKKPDHMANNTDNLTCQQIHDGYATSNSTTPLLPATTAANWQESEAMVPSWSQIIAAGIDHARAKQASKDYRNSLIAAVHADQQEEARRARTSIVHGLPVSTDKSEASQIANICQCELKADLTSMSN